MDASRFWAGVKYWSVALVVGPGLYGICKYFVWFVEMPTGKSGAPYLAAVISVTVAAILLPIMEHIQPGWFLSWVGDDNSSTEG